MGAMEGAGHAIHPCRLLPCGREVGSEARYPFTFEARHLSLGYGGMAWLFLTLPLPADGAAEPAG